MPDQEQSNIRQETNVANTGLNMDQTVNQVQKGQLTYALNAAVENFDATSVNYQNEPGNISCLKFPENYHLIGEHFINEQNKHIFFLTNPDTGASEIGYMDNNDCVYRTYINADCLNFSISHPIHKAVHKITNCTTEIYWTDGLNPRRYLDLTDLPYVTVPGDDVCNNEPTTIIDCNRIKIQPNFLIPELDVIDVRNGGELKAGTYQFAIQYCGVNGDAYTSYYSVTNPTPIADVHLTTPDFNYPVGRSIMLRVSNLDTTGYYQYYNLAVIKTVNAITSVELIGTYFIDGISKNITYTGQSQTSIRLTIDDIFVKYPYYDIAQDLTAVQDILVWDNLTSVDRINYQQIANQITLNWQTYKLPANEDYADELNATNLRGYLRDEVYAFEIVFLLRNGKQTDGFHIPGRAKNANEVRPDVPNTNNDFIGEPDYTTGGVGYSPYWKIYNTASVIGNATGVSIGNATPYKYGEFAYWESIELYPCNTDIWGDLANTPIRHHKFPDVLVSPIFETGYYTTSGTNNFVVEKRSVFPIGVKIDSSQIESLIIASNLTAEQKSEIVGFKIVRGNRSTNKSIVAKGILRNVGKYNREGTDYYFPNYPYNDLREDPFLLEKNNAYNLQCITWTFTCDTDGYYNYTDCYTNTLVSEAMTAGQNITVCSMTEPTTDGTGSFIATPVALQYDVYRVRADGVIAKFSYIDPVSNSTEYITLAFGQQELLSVKVGTVPNVAFVIGGYTIVLVSEAGDTPNLYCLPNKLNAFATDESKYRFVFNSPETSFGTPFLGKILKLESAIFGAGSAHFVQVKKNATYKLLTKQAQQDALAASEAIAAITGTPDPSAMFAAYQSYLQIYINGITRRNYAYSYNSTLNYDYWASIDNNLGVKQRDIELVQYLIPGVQSAGDDHNINNYQRESSVYIKTVDIREDGTTAVTPLPFPSNTPNILTPVGTPIIQDKSRYIVSTAPTSAPLKNCSQPGNIFNISSVCYYGSLKNSFVNQWGQMYSYETIDTGYQRMIGSTSNDLVVFGGDTFISEFSFKTKLPFFIDNRVGAPDDSDIFYDEIGNVAYPTYWHSSRSILSDYVVDDGAPDEVILTNIISIKAHNFDCPNNQNNTTSSTEVVNQSRTYYDGKFYLFAYGIPTFYCESAVNVDLRQAYNNKEGDFYPHVSTGIPDDWVQESNVSIAFDNSYYYNTTYSKQNVENSFSHLPVDWTGELCYTNYPFRAIYSESQDANPDVRVNSWLSYLPAAQFDFPQNYGKLVSLDGIQNKAVLARFENKSLLYNALLTMNTSNTKAAYIGNDTLFKSSPPIDFAETDLGYVGSQNKMLLKIPQGQITVDAKRGQVFLIAGNQARDLSAFGSGLNRFFTDHLAFEILRYYPNVPTDNHFNGVGLHGVYDSKYDRVIITKLDYIPLTDKVKYDATTDEFYTEQKVGQNIVKTIVYLTDNTYFCNKSWTLSYNMNTQSWVSFHSYIPNWYIAENNFFYSGLNEGCDLHAIAVEEIPSTTTTTTTPAPITTTTTTTVAPPVCTITGTAKLPDCTLTGTATLISECTIAGTAQLYLSFTVGAPSGQASAVCPASAIGWRVDTWYIVNGTIYSFGTTETFSVPAGSLVTIESVVADDYYIYNPGAGFQYCDLRFKPYIDATINGSTTTTYGTEIVQGLTEGTSTPHSSTLTYTFNPTQGNTYSFVAWSVQA